MGIMLLLLVVVALVGGLGERIDAGEGAIVRWFADLRTPWVTTIMRWIANTLGSVTLLGILRWGTILTLLASRRLRHFFVFLGAILAAGWVTTMISLVFVRARPLDVDIIGHWQGSALPSKPIAALAVTLFGMCYTLVPSGRGRFWAKLVARTAVLVLAIARLYLGVDHPLDIVIAAGAIGAAIPVIAFRLLTPNEVFPVTWRRGRAAHLDVGGERGRAIQFALEQQLGIQLLDMKPFGLGGSGGSTPLRLRVRDEAGGPDKVLFAKLYAQTHLRADKWYKLGRTLLYGRLEDESSFSNVRRLVQYEDYLLRAMRDAGLSTATSYGVVEITPQREYLIVTDFVDNAVELLEADVDDEIIDEGLAIVRKLWDAGIAHRDIKPSNLLVQGKKMFLIDVAFGEIRPSPWRQAVDLANMMIVLAIRSDPERVYERALRQFTPAEVAEAFAATRGVTMPSQSRSIIRKQRLDIVNRFRELAPKRPRIPIQRWTWRRAVLTTSVILAALLAVEIVLANLVGAGLVASPQATQASYGVVIRQPECRQLRGEQLILEAQSVPSALFVPCLASLPPGWSFRSAEIRDGATDLFFDSDRAGPDALKVMLRAGCQVGDADKVFSEEPGADLYERFADTGGRYQGSRFYTFPGGCVSYHLDFHGVGRTTLANEVADMIGLQSRSELAEEFHEMTGLNL
jgi:tRNA A-37 threonylcarbamoyl transferase component Bud32